MKEFKLPNAWYIKVTLENKLVLEKWRWPGRIDLFLELNQVVGITDYNQKGHNPETSTDCFNNFQITYDQFVKYVLNQELTLEKEIKKENLNYLIDLFKELNIN